MSNVTKEDVVKALGNLSVMEMIALTRKLEAQWGVKAEPPVVQQTVQTPGKTVEAQTEFTVMMVSYPADKKMTLIKAIKEITLLGLKEAKDFVESVPRAVKEGVSKEEAELVKHKLTEAGAVVEVK